MISKENITGIILAGGKSSRMGSDKGVIPLQGKPMIRYIIDAIKPLIADIIIIANNTNYNSFGFKVYPDLIKDYGPVAGIYTGLQYSTTDKNIVMSCDTPLITTELLKYLIIESNNHEITVPIYNGNIEPLAGIYQKSCASKLKVHIDNNEKKLMKVISQMQVLYVDVSEKFEMDKQQLFFNVNSPVELITLQINKL